MAKRTNYPLIHSIAPYLECGYIIDFCLNYQIWVELVYFTLP